MQRVLSSAASLFAVLSIAACATISPTPSAKAAVDAAVQPLPVMRWDHTPKADQWTEDTLAALRSEGAPLLSEIPADISEWCPGYTTAETDERAAFWAGMLSTLAKHESTWNPRASGGGGQWIGLVQIAPATARGYGCEATSVEALKNGSANLACAVRIAAVTVLRDGVVASGKQGLAADWAPFLNNRKRNDMVNWISQQNYCQAPQVANAG